MFETVPDDLPKPVAAVKVGLLLIVRPGLSAEERSEALALCAGCSFRVVLESELNGKRPRPPTVK